jgi:hypothetical protein
MLVGMMLHLTISYGTCYYKTRGFEPEKVVNRVFDSLTFSSSGLLLLGIFEPTILALIGSTKIFLLVAGVGGFLYGIHRLFPRE